MPTYSLSPKKRISCPTTGAHRLTCSCQGKASPDRSGFLAAEGCALQHSKSKQSYKISSIMAAGMCDIPVYTEHWKRRTYYRCWSDKPRHCRVTKHVKGLQSSDAPRSVPKNDRNVDSQAALRPRGSRHSLRLKHCWLQRRVSGALR